MVLINVSTSAQPALSVRPVAVDSMPHMNMTAIQSSTTCKEAIDRHWANPEMMGLGALLSGRVTKEGLDIPHIFTFVAAKDHKLVHDPEASHWEGEGPLMMRVTLEDLVHNRHEVPELDPALNGWLTDLLTAFPTHWHRRLIQQGVPKNPIH